MLAMDMPWHITQERSGASGVQPRRNLKIKLLANLAWYATDKGGQLNAFLLRGDANNWAKAHGGKVYDFNNAQKLVK